MNEKPIALAFVCKPTNRLGAFLYPAILTAIIVLGNLFPSQVFAKINYTFYFPHFLNSGFNVGTPALGKPGNNFHLKPATENRLAEKKLSASIKRARKIPEGDAAGTASVTANAGTDQNLPAGTTQVTLNGSVSGSGGSNAVNLVVIQGESNAAGLAYNSQASTAELAPRTNVKIINNNTLQFETLQLGVNNNILENVVDQSTHGLENGLANAVDAGQLTKPTYLVKAGGSGSWISEWLSNGTSRNPGQYGWSQLVARMDAAVNYLKSKGIPYTITVWQSIGINDYNAGTTNATYQSRMIQFRTDFRNRYGQNIPFLTTHFFSGHPYNPVIDAIAASDPLGICSAIDVSGTTYRDPNVHWDYNGFKVIASRMVALMVPASGTSPVTTNWTKISGPAGGNISSPANLSTNITALQAGTYTFRLTASVSGSPVATDDVIINVAAPAANKPPVANAGADISITLPTNTASLTGTASSDPDGTISSYAWTQVSGPNTSTLASPAGSATGISGLVQGVYVFQLKVTDNGGLNDLDSVSVIVNPAPAPPPPANKPPASNAGADISITLPTSTASLTGTASSDPDGTISSYAWTQVSGPNTSTLASPAGSATGISGLVQGVYVFQLKVTDNGGLNDLDSVSVIVNPAPAPPPPANKPPVASAGTAQSITLPTSSVILDGSGSTDPDGTIKTYSWVTLSGPGSVTILNSNTAKPTASGLQTGIYTFELTVTDNLGATAKAQVTVTVYPKPVVPNQAPVANAGSAITISLPQNSTTLSGASSFDADGTIASFAWTQVSGPSSSVMTGTNTGTATVSGLITGVYTFQLTVTDNNNATDNDQVVVTVNPAPVKVNIPPTADAGPNDTLILPSSTFTLNAGRSTDPDGNIVSYQWKLLSGPNTPVNSSLSMPQVSLSGLIKGEYQYEVTVTDDDGATATSTMKIVVEDGTGTADILSVFPNPAHNIIKSRVTSSVTGTVRVFIYDMSGKLVMEVEAEKTGDVFFQTYNISSLTNGLYTMQVVIGNRKTMVTKFIKN